MEYQKALDFANKFYAMLLPACDRLEIVGSVKRHDKETVHDIEYLAILKKQRPMAEFGKPKQVYKTILDKILADMQYNDLISSSMIPRDGDRLKKRAIKGSGEINEFCFEIYIVTEETWGIQNVIRTGPSLFSHRFVTNKSITFIDKSTGNKYHGLLPNSHKYIKGDPKLGTYSYIEKDGKKLLLPTEAEAISILGLGWIDPADRRKVALNESV